MRDNELISGIISAIKKFLPVYGVNDFIVSRNAQLTDQFTSASRDSKIKTHIFVHQTAHQLIQNVPTSIFQDDKLLLQTNRAALINIAVLKFIDINDFYDYSPDDIAEITSDMFFDLDVIMYMRTKNIRMENRSSVRPAYFVNESERFENLASFDLMVTYESNRIRELRTFDKTKGNNYRI